MKKYVAITLFVGILWCIAPSSVAVAASPIDITIAPTSSTISITPGKSESHTFQILNSGTQTLTFSVSAQSYYPETLTYTPIFGKEAGNTQLHNWTLFPTTTQTINPGEVVTIPYIIHTPSSIPEGAQYMVIFAETTAYKDQGISTKKRVGMLVYAHPTSGKTVETGAAVFPTLPRLTQNSIIQPSIPVENTGNIDFQATATMTIANAITGKHIATVPLTQRIFPHTKRLFTLSWRTTNPLGFYRVTQTVTLPHANSTTSQVVLFISPVALLVSFGLLGVLLLSIVMIIRGRRHARRHHAPPPKN